MLGVEAALIALNETLPYPLVGLRTYAACKMYVCGAQWDLQGTSGTGCGRVALL